MRRSLVSVCTLLLALPLSGCLSDEPATNGDPGVADGFWFDFANATLPTGAGAHGFIADYIMKHPYRLNGAATQSYMDKARDSLQAELLAHGLVVERHVYTRNETVRGEKIGEVTGVNVLGIQNGTMDPDQWVVLSAHYDTTESTVYGAWDDGAGTAVLMELARTFSQWEFPFTIVYAFFDEEEQGLIGSAQFVREYAARDGLDILANINTDPPGLNWPCGDALGAFPVKIIHNENKVSNESLPRYAWLKEAMDHGLDATGVPVEIRDYSPGIPIATAAGQGVTGSSDHVSFDRVDIANVFLGGTPTTRVQPDDKGGGLVAALTYGLHTPLDTLEQMEARCTGGDGTLADGLQTIVHTFAHTLAFMAEHPAPVALAE